MNHFPSDWGKEKLGDLVLKTRPISYGVVKAGDYDPDGVLLVRAQDYSRGWVTQDKLFKVSPKIDQQYRRTKLVSGDILLTLVGSVGNVALVPSWLEDANITRQSARIAVDQDLASPLYCYYYLTSDLVAREIYKEYKVGAQPSINLGHVKKFEVPFPPLPEQRKIAEILSTWDEAIAVTEQLIAALEKRKKSLMQRLLTGQVRFPGFAQSDEMQETKFGDIPVDWEQKRIGQIAKVNANSLGSQGDNKEYYYVELSAVNEGNITYPTEPISYSELPSRARRIPHQHDVVMATVRPNLLGYATWNDDLSDYLVSTGFALISPKSVDDKDFIYQSLYGDVIQRQIHGLVTGSNYPAINSSEVKRLYLYWPKNPAEREKIGQFFRTIDDAISLHTQKMTMLQKQKKGLMQRLLTGKVRVKPERFSSEPLA